MSVPSEQFHLNGDDESNESSSSEVQEYAKGETKAVRRLRWVMFSLLTSVTILAVVGIYVLSRKAEQREFENEFKSHAFQILSIFQQDAQRKIQAVEALSERLTAYGVDSESKWPFVTVKNAARLFQSYINMANLAGVFVAPLVLEQDRLEWENYTLQHLDWLYDDATYTGLNKASLDLNITAYIKDSEGNETLKSPSYLPQWQYAPINANNNLINFNRMLLDDQLLEETVLQETFVVSNAFQKAQSPSDEYRNYMNDFLGDEYESEEPVTYLTGPVFQTFEDTAEVVGSVTVLLYWKSVLENILPDKMKNLDCVVENTLGEVFTYRLNGREAVYRGEFDMHSTEFDRYEQSATYQLWNKEGDNSHVQYSIRIYPTTQLEETYLSRRPLLYGLAMFFVFMVTSIIFLLYDGVLDRRLRDVSKSANRARRVVSNLFPKKVADRLVREADRKTLSTRNQMSSFLDSSREMVVTDSRQRQREAPIADFFPETTILFTDIRGFTAWSSVREPAQVFILLETLFGAFDKIAKKRRIFKVETVGDCYVAVAGLPTPREDHALVMVRFAKDCLRKMRLVINELENELGPGTKDLSMRFGLHSGPVTAGVLRGEKTRFQLFGDTMNTASRMESTCTKGRIQISETTKALLDAAGKEHWTEPREDIVHAKGKGEMQTYWVLTDDESGIDPRKQWMSRPASKESLKLGFGKSIRFDTVSLATSRLINWNVMLLEKSLKQIVALRHAKRSRRPSTPLPRELERATLSKERDTPDIVVPEYIVVPVFDAATTTISEIDVSSVSLSKKVERQLKDLVHAVALSYKDNEFHCFEHASHVTMSVSKLFSRITGPAAATASEKYRHSFGIVSDPLIQFACLFSALIHDAHHSGVPNVQLARERPELAAKYNNQSIAEKLSIDLSWDLLMQDRFTDLRSLIYGTPEEFQRFRDIVVTCVVATDVMDKELVEQRNARWEKMFHKKHSLTDDPVSLNRKATIVIEHILQTSDVSHTMQHWYMYRKWNIKLFLEMQKAFHDGRASVDPSDSWYDGELGFFDGYIIPLAHKLQDCGILGVASEEYVKGALENRTFWEESGAEIVSGYRRGRRRLSEV